MIERIVKSIQDLRALSRLHSENALSETELIDCKATVIDTLKRSRESISTTEIVEPLVLLREIYLEHSITLEEYATARNLLLNHVFSFDGEVAFYGTMFDILKTGLISVTDLHKIKLSIFGTSNVVREGIFTGINRLRSTYIPFVGGEYTAPARWGENNHFIERTEGNWQSVGSPNEWRTDDHISIFHRSWGGTLDWGTTAQGETPGSVIRIWVNEGSYDQTYVITQMQGLDDAELADMLIEISNPLANDSQEIRDIFMELIPII